MAHGIKKCLAPGQRGVKDSIEMGQEAEAIGTTAVGKPTCFGRKLDNESCFHSCPFKKECYSNVDSK